MKRMAQTIIAITSTLVACGAEPAPPAPPHPGEVAADLNRIRTYLDGAMPARLLDARTRQPIASTAASTGDVVVDCGEADAFDPLAYEAGVIYTGMLAAADATGDRRFADFTARRFQFIADALPYFRAHATPSELAQSPFRRALAPAALDDCGAMAAAMIQARLAGVGPDLQAQIDVYTQFIAHGQFRLPDGTMARRRPQPVSLWADDLYMSLPALAWMGRLTQDPIWWDDAVRNARQLSARLFRPAPGLFAHGWHADNPTAPEIYWGRANGWAVLALENVLDVVPADRPGRSDVLALLQASLRGIATQQSGDGRWHQVLDRNDSYLETSCSAMFVYGLAHAIDRGWISPVVYGPIALAGWRSVATQINARGQVENTCIGTTLGSDMVYYYRRPVSPYAMHGYGPTLLAGAEIIRLLQNPSFAIVEKNGTYHFVPR